VSNSNLERTLLFQIKAAGLPEPEREYAFAKALKRRFRFDLAWRDRMLACEIHGAIHSRGRHNRGVGMLADMEKINLAQLMGWRVLVVASDHIGTGKALEWIESALELAGRRTA
jgi:hypothetical protein